ncbi:MAG: S9 family peptidase [Candidatus Algichlamydia australiensis]|nr:S9 family peptidase [Chlamydiales bacterium]
MKKVLLVSLLSLFCLNAQTPLIPRETLFADPEKTSVSINPDGKHLSYLSSYNGVLNIWVKTLGKEDDHPVTFLSHRPISGYTWSTDGKYLLYLCDNGGDENDHLFSLDLSTNETVCLTPQPETKAFILQLSEKFPSEILVLLNERDPSEFDVHRINLETGKKEMVYQNKNSYKKFLADDSLSLRAAISWNDEGSIELHVKEPNDKDFQILQSYSMEDSRSTSLLSFSKESNEFFFVDSKNSDKTSLKAYSFTDKSIRQVFSSEKEEVDKIFIDEKTYQPKIVTTYYEKQKTHLINPTFEKHWKNISALGEGKSILWLQESPHHPFVLTSFVSDKSLPEYYLYNKKTQKTEFLFSGYKELSTQPLQDKEIHIIKARDSLPLVSYLTKPTNTKGPVPMVLMVHGGPWARDYFEYHPYHQWLANRGYAVLSVNFRGSTGFGKAFLNAGNGQWAKKMQDDLEDAVYWAIENGIADPKKIAIFGGSYGGYATLVGLTKTPKLFAAGIDIVGPSHLQTLIESIPPYWKAFLKEWELRVGPPGNKEFMDSISPLTYVDKIERPLLIMQGQNDPRVKMAESEQIVQAMVEKSIPVSYVVFPDEGHGFRIAKNRIASCAIMEDFLAKHLGGRAEPIGKSVENSSAKIPVDSNNN